MRLTLLCVMLLALAAAIAAASGTAHTTVDTTLNSAPYTDAPTVATLGKDTEVTVLSRQGGWYNASTAKGVKGWLVMTDIRFPRTASGDTWGSSWYSLFESSRSGATGTTATAGVRGLNTGMIQEATPAPAAVSAIGAYAADAARAAAFAKAINLVPQKVDYLGDDKEQQP